MPHVWKYGSEWHWYGYGKHDEYCRTCKVVNILMGNLQTGGKKNRHQEQNEVNVVKSVWHLLLVRMNQLHIHFPCVPNIFVIEFFTQVVLHPPYEQKKKHKWYGRCSEVYWNTCKHAVSYPCLVSVVMLKNEWKPKQKKSRGKKHTFNMETLIYIGLSGTLNHIHAHPIECWLFARSIEWKMVYNVCCVDIGVQYSSIW